MIFESQILSPVRRQEELPPEIYLPLVDSLYQDTRALLVGSFFVACSIFITYWKTGEILLFWCAVAFVVLAGGRGIMMRAYHRARATVTNVRTVRRWENFYVAAASASYALLGIWCFISFAMTSDPYADLVSYAMTVAYGTGIFGRNFAQSALCSCSDSLRLGADDDGARVVRQYF